MVFALTLLSRFAKPHPYAISHGADTFLYTASTGIGRSKSRDNNTQSCDGQQIQARGAPQKSRGCDAIEPDQNRNKRCSTSEGKRRKSRWQIIFPRHRDIQIPGYRPAIHTGTTRNRPDPSPPRHASLSDIVDKDPIFRPWHEADPPKPPDRRCDGRSAAATCPAGTSPAEPESAGRPGSADRSAGTRACRFGETRRPSSPGRGCRTSSRPTTLGSGRSDPADTNSDAPATPSAEAVPADPMPGKGTRRRSASPWMKWLATWRRHVRSPALTFGVPRSHGPGRRPPKQAELRTTPT